MPRPLGRSVPARASAAPCRICYPPRGSEERAAALAFTPPALPPILSVVSIHLPKTTAVCNALALRPTALASDDRPRSPPPRISRFCSPPLFHLHARGFPLPCAQSPSTRPHPVPVHLDAPARRCKEPAGTALLGTVPAPAAETGWPGFFLRGRSARSSYVGLRAPTPAECGGPVWVSSSSPGRAQHARVPGMPPAFLEGPCTRSPMAISILN